MACVFREQYIPSFDRPFAEEALGKLPGLFWRGKVGRETVFDYLIEYGDESGNKYRLSLYINEYHEASLYAGRFKRMDSGNWETTSDEIDIEPIYCLRMSEMRSDMLVKIRAALTASDDAD